MALQAQKDVYQAELKNVKTLLRILKHPIFLMRETQAETTSSLYASIHLPMISFMTCRIMLRGYNDAKVMLS